MASTARSAGRARRWLVVVKRPFQAIRRFSHWVRHSQADMEAVYGPNPNHVTDDERMVRAALILKGPGGGSGPQSGC